MPETQSSPSLRQIAVVFRFAGWISLWIQLVLGIISVIVLLFANFSRGVAGTQNQQSSGTGFGIFFAVIGVALLGLGVYFAFRYARIGRSLQSSNVNQRPRKADTIRILWFGLTANLVGMLLTIVGAQAIAGALLLRSLSLPQGVGAVLSNPAEVIRPVDIFVVQANTNIVAAHFAGLVASLVLLNRVK
ncbi:MAG: DUF3611 family protein [Chroococcidiopsidaceae cyanobacterium CP_BM_ER_R8_30]|nr:DUF3611 family protein [Chroococcidiopsidaceae cyanobacterium CP_BM_ER_R8_30]